MSKTTEIRIAIYSALAFTFSLIALIFIGASLWSSGFKAGAGEGAKATMRLCQSGHPSCWPQPSQPPPQKDPPVTET